MSWHTVLPWKVDSQVLLTFQFVRHNGPHISVWPQADTTLDGFICWGVLRLINIWVASLFSMWHTVGFASWLQLMTEANQWLGNLYLSLLWMPVDITRIWWGAVERGRLIVCDWNFHWFADKCKNVFLKAWLKDTKQYIYIYIYAYIQHESVSWKQRKCWRRNVVHFFVSY